MSYIFTFLREIRSLIYRYFYRKFTALLFYGICATIHNTVVGSTLKLDFINRYNLYNTDNKCGFGDRNIIVHCKGNISIKGIRNDLGGEVTIGGPASFICTGALQLSNVNIDGPFEISGGKVEKAEVSGVETKVVGQTNIEQLIITYNGPDMPYVCIGKHALVKQVIFTQKDGIVFVEPGSIIPSITKAKLINEIPDNYRSFVHNNTSPVRRPTRWYRNFCKNALLTVCVGTLLYLIVVGTYKAIAAKQ